MIATTPARSPAPVPEQPLLRLLPADSLHPIAVDADLSVDLDVGGRPVARARVTGTGAQVSVTVDHPDLLGADRRLVGQVADLLAGAGLTASVQGPGGAMARLGAEVSSRVGARATGSRHASIAPRGVWLLLRSVGRPTLSDTTASALGAVLAAVLGGLTAMAVRGLHRRRHHGRLRERGA